MAEERSIHKEISIAIWNLTLKSTLIERTSMGVLGLNQSDLQALSELASSGPMPAGHLSEALNISSGASTVLIDRLERKGFVRRSKDASDRRRIMVTLTPAGREKSYNICAPLLDKILQNLESYSPVELQLIHGFLLKVNDLFQERVTELEEQSPQPAI